jgi:hypothetical protein
VGYWGLREGWRQGPASRRLSGPPVLPLFTKVCYFFGRTPGGGLLMVRGPRRLPRRALALSLEARGRGGLLQLGPVALGYVAAGRCLAEASQATRTLDVVAVVARGRGRQVAQLATARQVGLHLLSRAYRVYEVLVLSPPIALAAELRLELRLRRCLALESSNAALVSPSLQTSKTHLGSRFLSLCALLNDPRLRLLTAFIIFATISFPYYEVLVSTLITDPRDSAIVEQIHLAFSWQHFIVTFSRRDNIFPFSARRIPSDNNNDNNDNNDNNNDDDDDDDNNNNRNNDSAAKFNIEKVTL